jgi:hypothetical protein
MKKYYTLLIVFSFIIFSAGCKTQSDSVIINNIKICSNITGSQCQFDNPNFSPSTKQVFVSCTIEKATIDTGIDFSWFYNGQTKTLITSSQLVPDLHKEENILYSSISKPLNGWPIGEYEVMISIVGTSKESIIKKFTVQ